LSSSRAAARSNSVLHAKAPHEVVQWNRLAAALAQILKAAFREMEVFELVEAGTESPD
jgi:hypothetical protein